MLLLCLFKSFGESNSKTQLKWIPVNSKITLQLELLRTAEGYKCGLLDIIGEENNYLCNHYCQYAHNTSIC